MRWKQKKKQIGSTQHWLEDFMWFIWSWKQYEINEKLTEKYLLETGKYDYLHQFYAQVDTKRQQSDYDFIQGIELDEGGNNLQFKWRLLHLFKFPRMLRVRNINVYYHFHKVAIKLWVVAFAPLTRKLGTLSSKHGVRRNVFPLIKNDTRKKKQKQNYNCVSVLPIVHPAMKIWWRYFCMQKLQQCG